MLKKHDTHDLNPYKYYPHKQSQKKQPQPHFDQIMKS